MCRIENRILTCFAYKHYIPCVQIHPSHTYGVPENSLRKQGIEGTGHELSGKKGNTIFLNARLTVSLSVASTSSTASPTVEISEIVAEYEDGVNSGLNSFESNTLIVKVVTAVSLGVWSSRACITRE